MNILYKLRCLGYVEIDDDIWFANLYFNALVKWNKVSGKMEIVDPFPNYDASQGWLYSTVHYLNGYLVFVPNTSREIVSYDLESRKFVSTPLEGRWLGTKTAYFVSAYVYKNYVYLFPAGALCIVRYDVTGHTVKYLENSLSELASTLSDTRYYFYQQFEVIDKKIYLPFLELNAIAVFDLEDESVDIRYMNIRGGCSTINFVKGRFYLASWKFPEIYCWDGRTEEIETYYLPPGSSTGDQTFLYACHMDETLLYFPEKGNTILSFSLKTGRICEEKRIENSDLEPLVTFCVQRSEKMYCTLIANAGFINCISYADKKLSLVPCCYVNNPYNKTQMERYFIQHGFYEILFETVCTLKEYLGILPAAHGIKRTNRKQQYGNLILNEVQEKTTNGRIQ